MKTEDNKKKFRKERGLMEMVNKIMTPKKTSQLSVTTGKPPAPEPKKEPVRVPSSERELRHVSSAFDIDSLRKYCTMSETELFRLAEKVGFTVSHDHRGRPRAYRPGTTPILAVAHCDTVLDSNVFAVDKKLGVVMSPNLDDRLGVYTLLELLPRLGIKPHVLLSTDEERCASTAEGFAPPKGQAFNWMFSFDRRGSGAVTYQYDEMIPHLKGFFEVKRGSFSDLSVLDSLGVAGVNIGTAYHDEHSYGCRMYEAEFFTQIAAFVQFWNAKKDTAIPHAASRGPKRRSQSWGYGGYGKYDDPYDHHSQGTAYRGAYDSFGPGHADESECFIVVGTHRPQTERKAVDYLRELIAPETMNVAQEENAEWESDVIVQCSQCNKTFLLSWAGNPDSGEFVFCPYCDYGVDSLDRVVEEWVRRFYDLNAEEDIQRLRHDLMLMLYAEI